MNNEKFACPPCPKCNCEDNKSYEEILHEIYDKERDINNLAYPKPYIRDTLYPDILLEGHQEIIYPGYTQRYMDNISKSPYDMYPTNEVLYKKLINYIKTNKVPQGVQSNNLYGYNKHETTTDNLSKDLKEDIIKSIKNDYNRR